MLKLLMTLALLLVQEFNGSHGAQVCLEKVFHVNEDNGQSVLNIIDVPGSAGDWVAVGQQLGIVFLWATSGRAVQQRELPLMDISDRVDPDGERGLLGLAFHKDFTTNGRIFASFVCSGAPSMNCLQGTSIVEEFLITGDLMNPNTWQCSNKPIRRVVEIGHLEKNHYGGQILFSKDSEDGNLFLMLGDGGGAGDPNNHAQDLMSLQGKILRLNIDGLEPNQNYSIPFDNPFITNDKARHEIWAYGLRNPWRCSFDSESYVLICGDVGQDRVEEVDEIVGGANYGWRPFEGSKPFATSDVFVGTHTLPIYEYYHATSGKVSSSITGGYIYHPKAWTDPCLAGKYIFGDYSLGLMVGDYQKGQMSAGKSTFKCANDSPMNCGTKLDDLATFGEDGRGRVYISTGNGVFRVADPTRCGFQC